MARLRFKIGVPPRYVRPRAFRDKLTGTQFFAVKKSLLTYLPSDRRIPPDVLSRGAVNHVRESIACDRTRTYIAGRVKALRPGDSGTKEGHAFRVATPARYPAVLSHRRRRATKVRPDGACALTLFLSRCWKVDYVDGRNSRLGLSVTKPVEERTFLLIKSSMINLIKWMNLGSYWNEKVSWKWQESVKWYENLIFYE